MKNFITYSIIILTVCSLCVLGGYLLGRKSVTPTIVTSIDTTIHNLPAPVHVQIVDKYKFPQVPTLAFYTDSIETPYYIHDTLVIPIEQKTYESAEYKAWISGFKPQLDSIMIYNTTTTIIPPQVVNKPPLWGLYAEAGGVVVHHTAIYAGIEAEFKIKEFTLVGRGGIYYPKQTNIQPYVMVGLKYNLR